MISSLTRPFLSQGTFENASNLIIQLGRCKIVYFHLMQLRINYRGCRANARTLLQDAQAYFRMGRQRVSLVGLVTLLQPVAGIRRSFGGFSRVTSSSR